MATNKQPTKIEKTEAKVRKLRRVLISLRPHVQREIERGGGIFSDGQIRAIDAVLSVTKPNLPTP